MAVLDFDIQKTPVNTLKASVGGCKEPKTEKWVSVVVKMSTIGRRREFLIGKYNGMQVKVYLQRKITYQVWKELLWISSWK